MAIFEVTHVNGVEQDTPYDASFTPETILTPVFEVGGNVVIRVPNGTPDGGYTEYTVSDSLADVNTGLSTGSSGNESAGNKVTSMSSASTDVEYPSAKASYDAMTAIAGQHRLLMQSSGLVTDGDVAGTYALGNGGQALVSGGDNVTPLSMIYIDSSNFATVNGLLPKLCLAVTLDVNEVAPTGNFTVGLYPVTRPNPAGGAGVLKYTLGTVVASSTNAFTTPAARSQGRNQTLPFTVPPNGWYVVGVVTTATVAASSRVHINARLCGLNA